MNLAHSLVFRRWRTSSNESEQILSEAGSSHEEEVYPTTTSFTDFKILYKNFDLVYYIFINLF